MPSDYKAATKTGIKYAILTGPGDIRETWKDGLNQTTVFAVFDGDVETAGQFLRDMLGTAQLTGSQIQRTLPESNPWDPWQICVDAQLVKSVGNPNDTTPGPVTPPADPEFGNWPSFRQYTYQLTFETCLYDVKADGTVTYEWQRFCRRHWSYAGRNMIYPGGFFKFVNANKTQVNECSARAMGELTLEIEWLNVPKVPWARLDALAGRVNSGTMFVGLDGHPGFEAERVLLDAWKPVPRVSPIGQSLWTITLKFLIKTGKSQTSSVYTWNTFPSVTDGDNIAITADATASGGGMAGAANGRKPYLTADLNFAFSMT